MSANMDTTGTFAIAKEMSKVGAKTSTTRLRLIRSYLIFCYCFFSQNSLFTAVGKHFSVDEWVDFAKKNPESIGVKYKTPDMNVLFSS